MLYPLRFQPIYKERIWGGAGLRDELGRCLPGDRIGESWEITCREDAMSKVVEGPLQGKSLAELVRKYGPELLGRKISGENFPLLLKILDAREVLSVQVHPDDEFAGKHEGDAGKTEAWYILKARPGAKIVYGLQPGTTREEFASALKRGELERCLNEVQVKPGEVYSIPAGLVHALGSGIMVVELQRNSDLTYRVYDWNRVDTNGRSRPLHVEKALQVIEFGKRPPRVLSPGTGKDGFLLENECFSLYYHRVTGEKVMTCGPESFAVMTAVAGKGEIWYGGKAYSLKYGDSFLLPACLGEYRLHGELTVLTGYAKPADAVLSRRKN